VDIFFRRGDLSRGPPFIPALEVAGTIRKLGPAVPIDRSSRGSVSVRTGAAVIAAADWIGRDRVIERPSEGLNPWLIRTGKALE
jgi:hypothetical protein